VSQLQINEHEREMPPATIGGHRFCLQPIAVCFGAVPSDDVMNALLLLPLTGQQHSQHLTNGGQFAKLAKKTHQMN
jgi:hypothetical protein